MRCRDKQEVWCMWWSSVPAKRDIKSKNETTKERKKERKNETNKERKRDPPDNENERDSIIVMFLLVL